MNQRARRLAKLEERRNRKYPWGPLQAVQEFWDCIPIEQHEEFKRFTCEKTGEDYETAVQAHAEYEAWLATLSEEDMYDEQVKAADSARWETYTWLCKTAKEFFGEDWTPTPIG